MRTMNAAITAALIAVLALVAVRRAGAQVSDPLQYHLLPGSKLEYGCFGPCFWSARSKQHRKDSENLHTRRILCGAEERRHIEARVVRRLPRDRADAPVVVLA